jgi:hypothetical protein
MILKYIRAAVFPQGSARVKNPAARKNRGHLLQAAPAKLLLTLGT